VDVGFRVVVPLGPDQDVPRRNEGSNVRLIDVAVVPTGVPVGDHAKELLPAGGRVEHLELGADEPEVAVRLPAVDTHGVIPDGHPLRHQRAVRRDLQVTGAALRPVEGEVLRVVRLFALRQEPDSYLHHGIVDSLAVRIVVDVEGDFAVGGRAPASVGRNDLADLAHRVLAELTTAFIRLDGGAVRAGQEAATE